MPRPRGQDLLRSVGPLSYLETPQMIPGPQELVVILLIVIVLFGAKRIPQLLGGLGEGISNFKRGLKSDEETSADEKAEDNGSV